MITNSKTNLGGLLSSIGMALSGGGILTQLTQLFPTGMNIPNSVLITCWYVAAAGIVLKIVGTGLTAYFAADAAVVTQTTKDVAQIATAVDNINQKGASHDTALLSKQSIQPTT